MKPLPHGLIKFVFFDLDGTLVNSRGNVSEPVREEVFRLHERGVHVSFASGRPAFGATWLLKDLQIRDLCMFSSSSVIFDPVSQTPVEVSYLDEVILKAFLVAAERARFELAVVSRPHTLSRRTH